MKSLGVAEELLQHVVLEIGQRDVRRKSDDPRHFLFVDRETPAPVVGNHPLPGDDHTVARLCEKKKERMEIKIGKLE